MTAVYAAFLCDVIDECVEGQDGPASWSLTDAIRAVADEADVDVKPRPGGGWPVAGDWPVSAKNPARSLWPELKGRIVTAGWDAGAA